MNRKALIILFALFIAVAMPSALGQDQEKSKKEKSRKPGNRPALVAPEKAKSDAARPAAEKRLMQRLDRQAKALKALTGEVKKLKIQLTTMKKAIARRPQAESRKALKPGGKDDKSLFQREMGRRAPLGRDRAPAPGSARKTKRPLLDRKDTPRSRIGKAIGERLRSAKPDRARPQRAEQPRNSKKRLQKNHELQRRLRERAIERRR